MSEPSLIDIAGRLAILAANDGDENGDLKRVPKSIIEDAKDELDRLRAEVERLRETLERVDYIRERILAHVPHTTVNADIVQVMGEVRALFASPPPSPQETEG